MKKLLLLTILFIGGREGICQTKFASALKNTSRQAVVLIDRNNVLIQGYEGTEIKIEIDKPITIPVQADGLRRLNIKGLEDNSQLGLNISQEDSLLVIREVCNCYNGTYKILLPNKMNILIFENNIQHGQRWEVSDMSGNFEASTEFGHIYLLNVSGVSKAYSRHGSVNVSLNTTKGLALSSLYGKVVVELPETIKADLKVKSTEWSDIFTDFTLPVYENKQNTMIASLNGGGIPIELKSDHGNIYLRKKK